MSVVGGKLLSLAAAKGAGSAGAKKAAEAAARAYTKSLQPGFRELVAGELGAAAVPAAMSALYYGPAYYDEQDPLGSAVKIAGLTATDLAGSALLSAGARKVAMGIRPGRVTKDVSPKYREDLASLDLGVGATNRDIDAAKRRKLKEINLGPGDEATIKAKAAAAQEFADSLKNSENVFSDRYVQSGLSNAASMTANYGFSLGGMRAVEQGLVDAGVLKPTWLNEYQANQGTVPQEQIIAQQSQNRVESGVPNIAVTSPGTMSQLSYMEIQQLQDQLLAQASQEYEELSGVL